MELGSLGSFTLEDLACPICMEGLKDPFVTPCGHSFCYSCIIMHLQNKKICPCCTEYLTPDKVFPNYLLSKVVAKVAREAHRREGSLVEQLQAAIASDKMLLRLPDLDMLLETLEEKKHSLQQREQENNLELLLHFLNHSKLSKTRKLLDLQEELHILDRDIHHVESRQFALPASAPGLLALPDLPSPRLQRQTPPGPSNPRQLGLTMEAAPRGAGGAVKEDMDLGRPQINGRMHMRNGDSMAYKLSMLSRIASNPLSAGTPQQEAGEGLAESAVEEGPASETLRRECVQAKAPTAVSDDKAMAPGGPSKQETMLGHVSSSNQQAALSDATPAPDVSEQQSRLLDSQPSSPATELSPPTSRNEQAEVQGQAEAGRRPQGGTSDLSSALPSDEGATSMTTRTSSDTGHYAQPRQKRRFESQFEDLQQHYLRMRQQQLGPPKRLKAHAESSATDTRLSPKLGASEQTSSVNVGASLSGLEPGQEARAVTNLPETQARGPAEPAGLHEFSRMLSMSQRSTLQVVASMPGASQHTSAAILSSLAFDKSAEVFASAGVSKRIFVYNFREAVEAYRQNPSRQVSGSPLVQLRSRSKLSCLSYNHFNHSHLMSSDYEGVITLWDTQTAHPVTEYEAHDKRVWSVDFCPNSTQLLASGSDDGKVKVWSMNQQNSVTEINVRANVCSVRFSPSSPYELAAGSADHNVMIFDTRNHSKPVSVLTGHRKAVSYVLYMNDRQLVSASTDSTLRLWRSGEVSSVRKFSGHLNEKNFVGLSCEQDFIACGSETSEVFVYYQAMSKPIAKMRFPSQPPSTEGAPRPNSHFISAVCWRPRCEKKTLLAANSQGAIKVLQLNC